ncbi:MAG: ABC transporter permease [Desulfomonile tiedjei]|nr:ABC transporter permease [Desulfomonile tiedjei]
MVWKDLLRTAFKQVYRNRRRYKGAIIGTALGIAGLITVITMGDSVESTLGKNLEVLGSATVVKAGWDYLNTLRWHHGRFTDGDVEDLRQLQGALHVSPAEWRGRVPTSYGKKTLRLNVAGIEANFFEAFYLPMESGRRITKEDEVSLRQVCIIGQTVQKELFGPTNPLGRDLLVGGIVFHVIGVLGGVEDLSYMESVFVPLSTARAKLTGMRDIRHIYVRAVDWNSVAELHRQVYTVLSANHPGYSESLSIVYYPERIVAIQTIVFVFKFFLYSAIGVTLILGGLGITNVMLAVVNERTKEIGLRKAVGATEGMIVYQFLFESLTVSLVGALIGIICGLWAVEVLQTLFQTAAEYGMFLSSVIGSVLLAVFLGVASGLLPAARAGRLSAVEAMKFE